MSAKTDKAIADMTAAFSNINQCYAIIYMCENGLFIGHVPALDRVIAIMKKEAIRQLRICEKAAEKAGIKAP